MKIKAARLPLFRTATIGVFTLGCAGFFGYLLVQAGAEIPGVNSAAGYHVFLVADDVDNLVPYSDVDVAGVQVGKVGDMTRNGKGIRLELRLDPVAVPLHQGATVQVSEKSLAGQSYVKVVDGQGPVIPSGTVLPASAVKPSVQLRDVLAGLDPKTRAALAATIQSLGTGTQGSEQSVSQLMAGLGELGQNGYTALDAVSAQSEDITKLAGELTTVLSALNTGQDDLASTVRDANTLVQATAGQRTSIEDTMRRLPGVLGSAQTATGRLTELSHTLAPVAANLRSAAPELNTALEQLPQTTSDLRGLLPSLDGTLTEAPATLDRVPQSLGTDAQALIPELRSRLQDLNPMVGYLAPYGRDLGSFIANFHAGFAYKGADGRSVLRLSPFVNAQSVKADPLGYLTKDLLIGSNGYPAPGGQADPQQFSGAYPRLYPEPK